MNISVQELSSVDREITITATRADLTPYFDKALKNYRTQISLPGFRPGKVPMELIKKRFGAEIEADEVRRFVSDVFEKQIATEHKPIGESQFTNLKWENDQLEAVLKIGVAPSFTLVDPSSLVVDKLVHDVTDEDVQKELDYILEREGTYVDADTVTESSKITVDITPIAEDGSLLSEKVEANETFDLAKEEDLRAVFVGKKVGFETKHDWEEGKDGKVPYHFSLKKVENKQKAELNDELAVKLSNNAVQTVAEYTSWLKSRIQEYFDSASNDAAKNLIVEELIKAHSFEVPNTLVMQIQQSMVDNLLKQYGKRLPKDFDTSVYFNESREQAERDAKWMFIYTELTEKKYTDLEITPADIDNFLGARAAQYGVTLDMMKQFYASSGDQLEQLRMQIKEEKLYTKLLSEVSFNELSKEAYNEKYSKK